jgi:hypothetical protein
MSRRLRPYLLPVFFLLVMVGSWAVPFFIYTETLRSERYAAEVDQKINEAHAFEARERLLKQTLIDNRASRERLTDFSLASDGAAELITFLERGEGAGVSVSVGGVEIEPREGTLDRLKVSVRAIGSFDRMMRFVAYVETAPYAGHITAMSLTRTEGGEWEGIISYFVLIQRAS